MVVLKRQCSDFRHQRTEGEVILFTLSQIISVCYRKPRNDACF
jgi:hypothetical protein